MESDHPLSIEIEEEVEVKFENASGISIKFDEKCDLPAKAGDYKLIKVQNSDGKEIGFYSKGTSKPLKTDVN
jgi:hypothetical protein